MVWPLVIAGAAALGSAAIQWYNSKQAREASQDELDQVRNLINKVQDPRFDPSMIMPEEVQVLQKYIPETIPYVAEMAPQLVRAQSPDAIQGRQAQLESLGYMRRLMAQGYDAQTAIEMARAQRAAGAEAASARATAQAEAQRRGFGGGPSFYEAGADQAAMDRLAMAQQQSLIDAAQRRMTGAQQAATMGSQIRGEDVSLEQANVAAINAFNQRQAQAQRDWMQTQADIRNRAQLYNIGEGQRVAEKNQQQWYDALVRNQGRGDTLAQQQYANQMARATGQVPMAQTQMGMNYEQAAQNNRAIQAATDIATKAAMEKAAYDRDQEMWEKGYAPSGYQKR